MVLLAGFLLAGTGCYPRSQLGRGGERTCLDTYFRDDLLCRIHSLAAQGWAEVMPGCLVPCPESGDARDVGGER